MLTSRGIIGDLTNKHGAKPAKVFIDMIEIVRGIRSNFNIV